VFSTSCEKIKRTKGPLKDWSELLRQLDELRASLSIDGDMPVRAKIQQIVPEYSFCEDNELQPAVNDGHLTKAAGQD